MTMIAFTPALFPMFIFLYIFGGDATRETYKIKLCLLILNVLMACWKAPATVLLIMGEFDTECDAFAGGVDSNWNPVGWSLIFVDIVYYSIVFTTSICLLKQAIKLEFRLLFGWILILINCMEIINVIFCGLNYWYLEHHEEDAFEVLWISLTIITIPLSLSFIIYLYIDKHILSALPMYAADRWASNKLETVYNWAIFNHLSFFNYGPERDSENNEIMDRIYCIVHINRYHDKHDRFEEIKPHRKSTNKKKKLSLNSNEYDPHRYLSLDVQQYKQHELEDDLCRGALFHYFMKCDDLEDKESYVYKMLEYPYIPFYKKFSNCSFVIFCIYIGLKFVSLILFPIIWFFYYYLVEEELEIIDTNITFQHFIIEVMMTMYLICLVLIIIVFITGIVRRLVHFVVFINGLFDNNGYEVREQWQLYNVQNLDKLHGTLAETACVQYLLDAGITRELVYIILEYLYPNVNIKF